MSEVISYSGGENFSLRDVLLRGRRLSFDERTKFFSGWIGGLIERGDGLFLRRITQTEGREVEIIDPHMKQPHRMLMFGSNNYLGLTTHPYVKERVKQAINVYGTGLGGPPILNGYTALCAELEERLSAMKGQEETVIFSSGYGTNVGMLSSILGKHDVVFYDAYSHASFHDGLKMADAPATRFEHNDVEGLQKLLESVSATKQGDVFVGVEGVYSMDGDLAPLDQIVPLTKKHGAILIVDDAHGTGVIGPQGKGTASHFGVERDIDILMGTFSKAFGVTGGFISASKPVADYIRYLSRSYMFSAALTPIVLAAVSAALDVMERESYHLQQLWANVDYVAQGLRRLGFDIHPQSPIIPLIVPETMSIRKAGFHFHKRGIFLNTIEYPAVPINQQRFRICLMASHTQEDLDRLLEVIEEVWATFNLPQADTRRKEKVREAKTGITRPLT